jgi:oligoribonuclease
MTGNLPNLDRLVWLDLEMTGLDPDKDRIIEIAMVITNANLEVIAQSAEIAIYQSPQVLDGMDAWNKSTHARTGLIDRVSRSTISDAQAEAMMLDFLNAHLAAKESPMCGNSICQDRRFLARYMPTLEAFFHYRDLDVSTIKELARRWYPDIAKSFKKRSQHSALADIQESIDELRHYRTHLFRVENNNNIG